MRKPNLFIVGAMKCGTTAWYDYLRSHTDIFMPELKEPGFFAPDVPKWQIILDDEEYLRLFSESGGARVLGEASTSYLISETAAKAIRDYNPAAKILIFLRDQEEYLPSLHNQNLSTFAEDVSDFETAWKMSGPRRPDTIPPTAAEPKALDYVAMGRFEEQVRRYFDAFPPEQIRVIWFRDWVADPRSTYVQILDFLGLEDDGRGDFRPANEGVTIRFRRLAHFLDYPPTPARKLVRLFKRVTGLQAQTQKDLVGTTVRLLSARGYKKIRPELREEIRRFYAEDNRRLNELVSSARCQPVRTGLAK